MKLSVIVPVFNEEKTIGEIIRRIDDVAIDKEVIVVDDGSSDKTAEIIRGYNSRKDVKTLFHDKNRGKGAAIRTGLKHAEGDVIIIQDADLEYDPSEYQKLIQPILSSEAEVVYGSRNIVRESVGKSSNLFYIGGILLTKIANLLYGSNLTDVTTCYKVFKKDVIDSIKLECDGFEFCDEVTAKILKKGINIKEVPITYHPRSKEEGKKIRTIDGLIAAWTLIKFRLRD